jgi:fluoride ion exporter CrcB/FEX
MRFYLLIALFGALGTLARYSVIKITSKIFQTTFLIRSITINSLAYFLIVLIPEILDTKFYQLMRTLKIL